MKGSLFCIAVVLLFLCCDSGIEGGFTQFVVRVDSVAHAPFAASNDTLTLLFFGTIGSDGCCSFSHFETTTQPLQLDITVWGQHRNAGVCPAVMVYLDGKEYRFVAGHMGWFVINVHQPDNSVLRDSILIK